MVLPTSRKLVHTKIRYFMHYVVTGVIVFIFQVTGELEVSYISGETPMVIYLNVHMAIEQMRQKVEKQNDSSIGPKVWYKFPYTLNYVLTIYQ